MFDADWCALRIIPYLLRIIHLKIRRFQDVCYVAPPFEQCCTSSSNSDAVRVASSALLANDGMFSRTLHTFKRRFFCLICPELLHSYHNCNVDSFFATDEQFQYGMNVDFNRLTNAHFRHSS